MAREGENHGNSVLDKNAKVTGFDSTQPLSAPVNVNGKLKTAERGVGLPTIIERIMGVAKCPSMTLTLASHFASSVISGQI